MGRMCTYFSIKALLFDHQKKIRIMKSKKIRQILQFLEIKFSSRSGVFRVVILQTFVKYDEYGLKKII